MYRRFFRVTLLLSASFSHLFVRGLNNAGCLQASVRTHLCSRLMSITSDVETSPTPGNIQFEYTIREALYSELPEIASLITSGFHPELDSNPILRPIRVLLELDRLQNNFPFQGDDKHLYLACETKIGKKVVAFCDIDARIPAKKKDNPFSLFVSPVNRPHPYFSDLTVDSNYRRKGVASALVKEGERRAKEMNCQEMYLGVACSNTVALNLYSNMGYEIIVPTGDILEFVKRQEGVRMLRRTLN